MDRINTIEDLQDLISFFQFLKMSLINTEKAVVPFSAHKFFHPSKKTGEIRPALRLSLSIQHLFLVPLELCTHEFLRDVLPRSYSYPSTIWDISLS
ncbi:hypothetical protein NB640_01685 [Oxalobacter vibrioformis]|uniref:Uncharacterized protein n=1 Tax=Oxalobacter vibrioformis TaxID=933080 RepID=A0A9E9M0R4_9BURK|nr:hypothetical protein [Oxalobacter vibrioformis]WAW10403.1 hypothetical protein NB640_01685 [Oxalobacter vibrioformis]